MGLLYPAQWSSWYNYLIRFRLLSRRSSGNGMNEYKQSVSHLIDTVMVAVFVTAIVTCGSAFAQKTSDKKAESQANKEATKQKMSSLIAKHYKTFKHINIGGRRHGIGNISRTVGLTGTKLSRNRGRGKISLVRQRTGRRQFKRRLGRRRRSGRFIARKDMNVG